MAKLRVIFSRRAVTDLDDIWSYIAENASAEVASGVIAEILEAIDRLREMPGMGHSRSDLLERYRPWRVFQFLIVYRFDANRLFVVRIVHGRRDIRRVVGR